MLYFVPLAGAGRDMTDGDLNPKFVGQHLQFALPQAQARAVAAATVGVDRQLLRLRVTASRSRASVHHPCGGPARCIGPGPEVRQTAAYGAAGNSGGPRNRNNSAAAGSACFTGGEQASVSFVAERSECIIAGPDGILVDHPARLDAKTPNSHQLFRVRSLRYCGTLQSFLPSRLFWLRPLAAVGFGHARWSFRRRPAGPFNLNSLRPPVGAS